VRLRQGRMDDETHYSDDPVAVARRWQEAGARRLHLVDLDGARDGRPRNLEVIHEIVAAVPDLPVEVGGGIREEETIDAYLDAGARWVIIGTRAVTAAHFLPDMCRAYPGHVIVGLDARDGKVATEGWSKLSRHDAVDMAQRFARDGAEAIIYTEISRDGMLSGVDAEATARIARAVEVPVIASGGVRDLDDVRRLCAVAEDGIEGVITGRALYDGTLDLAAAQDLADRLTA